MRWVFSETKQGSISPVPSLPNPYFFSQPPPPPPDPDSERMELSNKVSPGILLVIIILAIIFFVSGLLHLLVRFIMRPNHRDPEESDNATVLQGQLQQLFHLHDSGVDQSFIDTLPVFHYKAIIGLKNPFDCAVCLCEFEPEDKLRLLPKCSHAFHMECIDTWLLSHSTCPLCRSNLIPDFSPDNGRSPMVLVLESGRQSSREILTDIESNIFSARTNSNLGLHREDELGSFRIEIPPKSSEIVDKPEEPSPPVVTAGPQEKVVTVKLGKFRNVDGGGGEESSERNSKDARRCFSMGSFEYVMDERSSLQVPIRTPTKKQPNKKPSLPLKPGLRPAMSECDGESMRELEGLEPIRTGTEIHGTSSNHGNGDRSRRNKRESFSVSKIWLRGKEEKPPPPSRRAFSFRFPVHRSIPGAEEMKGRINGGGGKRSVSEADFGRWESEETESRNSLDSGSSSAAPSFARRTLLWLVGRQNKVVHSPFPPNL